VSTLTYTVFTKLKSPPLRDLLISLAVGCESPQNQANEQQQNLLSTHQLDSQAVSQPSLAPNNLASYLLNGSFVLPAENPSQNPSFTTTSDLPTDIHAFNTASHTNPSPLSDLLGEGSAQSNYWFSGFSELGTTSDFPLGMQQPFGGQLSDTPMWSGAFTGSEYAPILDSHRLSADRQ
jgi:hypothetical protein